MHCVYSFFLRRVSCVLLCAYAKGLCGVKYIPVFPFMYFLILIVYIIAFIHYLTVTFLLPQSPLPSHLPQQGDSAGKEILYRIFTTLFTFRLLISKFKKNL
jgi:hypothetical protein